MLLDRPSNRWLTATLLLGALLVSSGGVAPTPPSYTRIDILPKIIKQQHPFALFPHQDTVSVLVQVQLDESGKIMSTHSAGDAPMYFRALAEMTVSGWTFTPARVGDYTVPIRLVVPVRFLVSSLQ